MHVTMDVTTDLLPRKKGNLSLLMTYYRTILKV